MNTGWRPAPGAALTPRETEVLHLVAAGESNDQIARRLNLSVHTVKVHVRRVGVKLGEPTRAGMVGVGYRTGVLRLPDSVVLQQASELTARRMASVRGRAA